MFQSQPHVLPMPAHEATKVILKHLPSRRMRDVVEKRFGLKAGGAKTLQAIGGEYKITRERVRQIESEALKQMRKEDCLKEVAPVIQAMNEHIERNGSVMPEHLLLASVSERRLYPHVSFLLGIAPVFHQLPETEHYHTRWATNKDAAASSEKTLAMVVKELENRNRTVSKDELHEIARTCAKQANTAEIPQEHVVHALLASSKVIQQNPYGEYGLTSWPSVNPSGVKDKAYVAITKAAKPLHFRDVADVINKAGWSKKKAHPQTVHNELIKDKRFVLVGRGLYALKEWGYEPGAVRDVIMSVMKESRRPLTKDEIVSASTKKRLVKVPTILLNLQNKKLFKKTDDGKYMIA